MRARSVCAIVALAFTGCSASLTGLFSVDGSWAEVETIPGNALQMTLTSSGSRVTGSGTYAGEAGPSGTVAVTGSTSGNSVHLDLVLAQSTPASGPITRESFDGKVTATQLRGTMTFQSSTPPTSAPVVFARQ